MVRRHLITIPKDPDSTRWHIHYQGGGWCYSPEKCQIRSTTHLGSSHEVECKSYLKYHTGYLSRKKEDNSILYNFNIIHVNYCDGELL